MGLGMVEFFGMLFVASLIFQGMMYLQNKKQEKADRQYKLTLKLIKERNRTYKDTK